MNSKVSIKWASHISYNFSISNGVKQGGILSSHLFAIYLEPLIDEIILSQFGSHDGCQLADVFFYANDITILAPSFAGLNTLIKICKKIFGKISVRVQSC